MAFFSDTTNAPKIVDGSTFVPDVLTIVSGVITTWHRTIQTTSHRFTWLTQAAADSIAAAKTTGAVTASSNRMSDDGAYQVSVTTVTKTAWVQDT